MTHSMQVYGKRPANDSIDDRSEKRQKISTTLGVLQGREVKWVLQNNDNFSAFPIPTDVAQKILSYLFPESSLSFALTCKHIYNVIDSLVGHVFMERVMHNTCVIKEGLGRTDYKMTSDKLMDLLNSIEIPTDSFAAAYKKLSGAELDCISVLAEELSPSDFAVFSFDHQGPKAWKQLNDAFPKPGLPWWRLVSRMHALREEFHSVDSVDFYIPDKKALSDAEACLEKGELKHLIKWFIHYCDKNDAHQDRLIVITAMNTFISRFFEQMIEQNKMNLVADILGYVGREIVTITQTVPQFKGMPAFNVNCDYPLDLIKKISTFYHENKNNMDPIAADFMKAALINDLLFSDEYPDYVKGFKDGLISVGGLGIPFSSSGVRERFIEHCIFTCNRYYIIGSWSNDIQGFIDNEFIMKMTAFEFDIVFNNIESAAARASYLQRIAQPFIKLGLAGFERISDHLNETHKQEFFSAASETIFTLYYNTDVPLDDCDLKFISLIPFIQSQFGNHGSKYFLAADFFALHLNRFLAVSEKVPERAITLSHEISTLLSQLDPDALASFQQNIPQTLRYYEKIILWT